MSIRENIRTAKSNIFTFFSNAGEIKKLVNRVIPVGIPIALALILGYLLAFFIVNSIWAYVFGLLLLVFAVVLFIRYPFSVILIWVLLMPFLQTTISPSFRNAFWLVHRLMPLMAVIGYIVFSKKFNAMKRRSFPKPSPAEIAILIFFSITLINIIVFQSDSTPYIILVYDRIFIPLCLYFFVRMVEPRETDLKRLLPIIFVLVVIESFVGLLSQAAVGLIPAEWASFQGERAIGTFDNPHGYTLSLAFFILLLYHGAMHTDSKIVRAIYLIGVAMGLFGSLNFLYPGKLVRIICCWPGIDRSLSKADHEIWIICDGNHDCSEFDRI